MSNISSYPSTTIAKLLDITERRVHQLVKEGILPRASRGNYELVPCVQGYIRYLRRERLANNDVMPISSSSERTRLIKIQADKLELEMGILKGKILYAKEAETGWNNLVARCRAVLLGIPNRLAHQLASISNPQELAHLLKQAIYEALLELTTTNNIGEEIHETAEDTKQDQELSDQANN